MREEEIRELATLLADDDFARDLALGVSPERAPELDRLRRLNPWQDERYSNSDIGNGYLFADYYKDEARFVSERKCWYIYDGSAWRADLGGLKAMELCKRLATMLFLLASEVKDTALRDACLKRATRWHGRRTRETILKDASGVYCASMTDFDRNHDLFNCLNGTLNLRTLEFREHRPGDMLTALSGVSYDLDARCDRWERFIAEIMGEKPGTSKSTSEEAEAGADAYEKGIYLQKALGYLDRAVENAATRSALTAIQALTKVQSVAKVGGNFKSIALNTLPMMDSFCFHPAESLSALAEVWDWKDHLFDHPDLSRSNFFIARCGRERKAASTFDKATKTLFVPMDVSDRISTATVWLGNYRSLLKQLGGDEQQAIVMADSMTKRMMSSKLRGDKGEAYNSSVGGMFLQFTQEAVNRVGFIFGKDARRYSHGLGRALATIFGVFVSSFLVNKLAGANSTFDAIDIGWDAFKKRREGEDFKTVLGEAVTSFIDQLNPIDNLTSGNLFEAPSISAVSDVLGGAENAAWSTLGWVMDAAVEIGDYVFNGDEVEIPGFGLDWAKQIGNGLLGWVPGSTQGKRMVDAVKSYVRGYATNQRGNVKFETDGPFAVPKLGQALLFGVNAQPAGQKYVKEGYKGWKDDDWAKVENLKGHYGSYHEAVKHFNADKERTSEIGEINEKEKWGEATSEDLAKRESLYNDRGLPNDASAYFMENADTDWAKKALKLSNENNGAKTYPTKLPIQTDTKRGVKYFVYDKHNYEISDEIAEKMLEDYNYEAKKAIIGAKNAKELASELSGLVKKIKERYINEAGE